MIDDSEETYETKGDKCPIRLVTAGGRYNIKYIGITGQRKQFLNDFFTTMVDTRWRWNILMFIGGFIVTWLLFALFYYLVSKFHGDLIEEMPENWTPCFENINSFQSAFLFSIETQTTIGYGYRYVTESCPHAYFGVIIQNIVGAGLQAALAGLVVAKVRRGKKRSGTIVFSTIMCIVEADEKYKLMFRIGDMRKSQIIGIHIRGYLFKKVLSDKEKSQPVQCFPLDFVEEDGSPQILLAWPTNLVHIIDKNSPFWKISKEDLRQEVFELVIILDGTVGTTSQPFQAQTSYFPWDLKWGHRFVTLGKKFSRRDCHVVDFSNFNKTTTAPISDCSACQVDQFRASGYSVLKSCNLNNNTHITLVRRKTAEKKTVYSPRKSSDQYKQNKQYLASEHRY
ncbi:hypothetical protein FSP39_021783 [Pinctada imbricata]|uniref:Uncharacterized protein n=1 Tax=Pinctada imbricata TaxID=66713 RepID=A0AA88YAC7_PINIB|nr:hypothetical protein FSP39_021783 [Pinctada imbricata]